MKQYIENFFAWLVTSSADPTQTSLTIKGVFLIFIPGISQALTQLGVNVDSSVFMNYVNGIVAILGLILIAIGLGRKLYYATQNDTPIPPSTPTAVNTPSPTADASPSS